MREIELKGFKVEKAEFVNKISGNAKIELNNKYSYNVGYSKINTCKGEFKAEITDKKSPELFRISVTVNGFFITSEGIPKERLHLKTYDALFPYVKAFVSTLTANAGIPPVMMPYVDISNENIYRVEFPGKGVQ